MTQEDILNNPEKYDLSIETVGTGTLKSPMKGVPFVSESERVSLTADVGRIQDFCKRGIEIPSLEAAGPREPIFHDPAWTRAGIVTCGGLCPGLNNVIKGLVQVLWFDYGVRNIFGIPYGYRGLNPAYGYSPIILNPDVVDAIQEDGGTILGSSRGNQDAKVMVDTLMRLNINVLFCIGGDGTLRGAHDIAKEVQKRKQPISVIGIPKTIDNDLNLIDRTFGFETAYRCHHQRAQRSEWRLQWSWPREADGPRFRLYRRLRSSCDDGREHLPCSRSALYARRTFQGSRKSLQRRQDARRGGRR